MAEGPQLTPSQQQAVRTTGCSLLVSAAAGTGKTHVLAERCAYLVCEAKPRCEVDRLLVVTFTEAAAAEMRTRIGRAIAQRLEHNPRDGWLRRQRVLLDAATITTIHAFCYQLIRRWFNRIDLDPNVELLDADEADLLRRETLEALFAELYDAKGGAAIAEGFRDLVDVYGRGNDDRIAEMVLKLHGFVNSLPNPDRWLAEATERVEPFAPQSPLPAALGAARRGIVTQRLEMLAEDAKAEADVIRALYPAGADYADILARTSEAMASFQKRVEAETDDSSFEDILRELKGFRPDRATPARGLDDDAKDERKLAQKLAGKIHERMKRDLQDCVGVFYREAIADGLDRTGHHVRAVTALTQAFDARYRQAKSSEGRIDFTDLERYALELLRADVEATVPSETALVVQDEVEHVLVDEFQDVNPVQEAILRLVSRETDRGRADNLFAVGDVKQSIYRFRLAEPEIFVRRTEAFEREQGAGAAPSQEPHRLVWLQHNFRSRPEVLQAVNAVFEKTMTRASCGMPYDKRARLEPGAKYPIGGGNVFARPAVELHLLEEALDAGTDGSESDATGESVDADSVLDWEATEREARLVAQRILEMTGAAEGHEPMTVCEKSADPTGPRLRTRPIRLRDIVVLLRSTKNKANHYERVFRAMGIGVYADLTTGYFASLEVQDVLSLLRVIDNTNQDIPLAAVLRSPILHPRLTESQLVAIREQARTAPFHRAVRRYAQDGPDESLRGRLRRFLADVEHWRGRLRREPLHDVLWRILVETGYLAYVGGLRNGIQRRANLIRLHERARQFGGFVRQGLHRFLRFIEDLEREGGDLGPAPAVSEAEDVVRIMSIHRSKGLEFPVVVLPDLAKPFNFSDASGSMLYERRGHIGLPVVDLERGIRYPTLTSLAVAEEIRRQIRAEEMRILYVAMTRAREHLVCVATASLDRIEQQRARGRILGGELLPSDIALARSHLDWLLAALTALPPGTVRFDSPPDADADTPPLFTVRCHDQRAIASWTSPEQTARRLEASLARFANLEPPPDADEDSPAVRAVFRRLRWSYPHAGATTVPAVVAASELKRRLTVDAEADERRRPLAPPAVDIDVPRFARERDPSQASLSAAELGTLTHLVLQHLDLRRPCDVDDIAAQVDEMVARRLLTLAERQAIALEPVAWLFTTDLGARLRGMAESVLREAPFVLAIPPEQVVPGITTQAGPEDIVLARGMIDCLLLTDDGAEVIDFKTDSIGRDKLAERVALYRPQIEIYTQAVQEIWRRPVVGRWLAFLTVPEVVAVER